MNFKFESIFEPNSKAIALVFSIALVFCSKMTKFEVCIHFDCRLEKWWFLSDFWPKSKAIALVFCSKVDSNLKFIHLWICRLKSDWTSNLSRFLSQNSKAIALVFWLKNRLKFEVHSLLNLQIEKWMNFKFESIFEPNAKIAKAIALVFWLKNRLKFEVQSLLNLQIEKWMNFKFESIFEPK